jgi:hypothetical protein
MLANRKILQLIIDDPASTEVERTEAKRALGELTAAQSPSPPRRRGRNSNFPQSQEDLDSDVQNWYQRDLRDSSLTGPDRHEIFHAFDPSTQRLLDAFSYRLLGLFNAADPATVRAIADAVRWAEMIMAEIDRLAK